MKIFLTEYQVDDKIYAGFNIFAESLEEAEYVADIHGLTLVGEVKKIEYVPEFANIDYLSTIKFPSKEEKPKILH